VKKSEKTVDNPGQPCYKKGVRINRNFPSRNFSVAPWQIGCQFFNFSIFKGDIMSSIKVVSNSASREITLEEPKVLTMTSVADLVEALGEDLVVQQVKAQLKVSFRAVVRRRMEEKDDNDDFVNSDEAIINDDYSDWKPSLRVTKTPEERAKEALGNLPPEVREAVLSQFQNV